MGSLVGIGSYGDVIEFVNWFNSNEFSDEITNNLRNYLPKMFSDYRNNLEEARLRNLQANIDD